MKAIPRWIYYTVGLAAIAIVLATLLRIFTPQTVEVPQSPFTQTNINNTSTVFTGVRYTGPAFTPPGQLTVARASLNEEAFTEIVSTLVTSLALEPVETEPNTWQNPAYYLFLEEYDNRYILVNQSLSFVEPENHVNLTQAATTAEEFFTTHFPNIAAKPQLSEVVYSTAVGHYDTVESPAEADVVQIPFAYTLDNLPIFYANRSEYPFILYVTGDNKVGKVFFYPQSLRYTSLSKNDTLTIDQAIANINRNQGAIVSFTQDEGSENVLAEIKSAKLTNVTMEYRLDPDSNILYPFYRFSGTAQNATNVTLAIELITPAVATTP